MMNALYMSITTKRKTNDHTSVVFQASSLDTVTTVTKRGDENEKDVSIVVVKSGYCFGKLGPFKNLF